MRFGGAISGVRIFWLLNSTKGGMSQLKKLTLFRLCVCCYYSVSPASCTGITPPDRVHFGRLLAVTTAATGRQATVIRTTIGFLAATGAASGCHSRSEERRVGKETSSRG